MPAHRPFIVIEALDAGGSQTQTNLLVRRLKRENYTPHQYHFPQSDGATGRLIYNKFLHDHNRHGFSKREQALLYVQDFYSRADEFWHIIKKGTKREVVVSDRYCTSTMAYQTAGLAGHSRRQMLDWLVWLCWQGTPRLPKPDAVIFLNTPVEITLGHLASKKRDYHENRAKLTMFRRNYIKIAREQAWILINSVNEKGTQRTKQDIHREVWQRVSRMLR